MRYQVKRESIHHAYIDESSDHIRIILGDKVIEITAKCHILTVRGLSGRLVINPVASNTIELSVTELFTT